MCAEVIDNIISEIGAFEDYFDIKLMLTEAMVNTFNHGNRGDKDRPIHIEYLCDGESVEFTVKDSNFEVEEISIPDCHSDENLLNESGRGLFLINCIADEISISNKCLIMKKKMKSNSSL
ncbi:ATP-binding protein [Peptoclostridium litorale]|nr:ATP-binding protein [Peptoclostridium litorale]